MVYLLEEFTAIKLNRFSLQASVHDFEVHFATFQMLALIATQILTDMVQLNYYSTLFINPAVHDLLQTVPSNLYFAFFVSNDHWKTYLFSVHLLPAFPQSKLFNHNLKPANFEEDEYIRDRLSKAFKAAERQKVGETVY